MSAAGTASGAERWRCAIAFRWRRRGPVSVIGARLVDVSPYGMMIESPVAMRRTPFSSSARGGGTQDRRLRACRLLHGAGGGALRLRRRAGVRQSAQRECREQIRDVLPATPARLRALISGPRARSAPRPPPARASMASTARP